MTQEEKDKLSDYKQRQREWRDISVTQLSNTNNILLTLSAGLLAFCFDKSQITQIHFSSNGDFSWFVTTYVLAISFLGISMFYGLSVLFSRLYDFRISRHLALSRQRFHPKTFSDSDLGEVNFCHRINALSKVLFFKIPFLTSDEIKKIKNETELRDKFDKLRGTAKILGSASWIWTKMQVLYFLLSCLVYVTHRLLI